MIYFVLHEHHRYAVANFVDAWGRNVRPRVRVISHQDLRHATRANRGTYVFGDADRLTADERALSANVANRLAAAGCRVLNHPARVVWRHELCRRLEREGLNAYRCFRATDDWSAARFPAFVRREDDHGSLTRELLHDADAVRRAIAAHGPDASDLLVIEYVDTRGGDGIYRKYSALRVGGRPFPRHLLFSRNWIVKYADLVDETLHAEEERYLDDFAGDAAHAAQVARAFELAEVDYGRIDYSLGPDGRVQVWEINLSPNLGSPPNKIARERLATQWTISARIVDAIAALDDGGNADGADGAAATVPLGHDAACLARLGVGRGHDVLRFGGKVAHRVERLPGVRQLLGTYRRARWLASQ